MDNLVFKQELIGLTGVREEISDSILDVAWDELQPHFTKYAWGAARKKGTGVSQEHLTAVYHI